MYLLCSSRIFVLCQCYFTSRCVLILFIVFSVNWSTLAGAVQVTFNNPEGYIDVDKVLQHKSFRGFNRCDIERVVHNNEKQRFRLRVDPNTRSLQVKANQGHTIDVSDAELTPVVEAKYPVIHGTFSKSWPQIKQTGLSRMRRRHIHLAKGTDNTISGLRRNAQIHIYINLKKALQDGINSLNLTMESY